MTDRTLGTQLDLLWATIEQRRSGDPSKSYTAQLLSQGVAKAADKVTEEAAEAVAEGDRVGHTEVERGEEEETEEVDATKTTLLVFTV